MHHTRWICQQDTGEDEDRVVRRTPSTFYQQEFGGSVFPVYMTEEEYCCITWLLHITGIRQQTEEGTLHHHCAK